MTQLDWKNDGMRGSRFLARTVALLMSAGLLAACWPIDPLDDCNKNPYLECFWSNLPPATGAGGGDGGTPPGCIPSDDNPAIANTCGLFVSSSSGDDTSGDGSQAKPLKTLAAAVEQATAKGMPLYACAEEFSGSVVLANGIALYGGLDCANEWVYAGATKKSVLVGDADAIALTIAKTAGGAEVVDFTIQARDAANAGGSSIAVLVEQVTAELVRCELVAGNGAKGADGAPGDPNGMPATAGVAGNNGVNACTDADGTPGPDTTLSGGAQVTNECGSDVSIGGNGGNGNVPNGGGGDAGQTGTAGQSGAGEPAAGMWDCVPGSGQGTSGSSGEAGLPGAGAMAPGLLSASGYMGTSGGAGTSGKPGQGGGGGGGAKGGMICAPGNMTGSGASGGSGGAGGCGGLPGQGGAAGGASIALVSLNASVTLTDCTLSSSQGGDGGAGGDAQAGGAGGDAGKGGAGAGVSNPACDGGKGGKGGNGGPGGGGLGGPSLGIAFSGTAPLKEGQTSVTAGTAGIGGPGGSANVAMNAGADGIAAEQQEFP